MSQISCPRRGHHPGKAPQRFDSEDEEATIISQETRRIDDLIHGLYEERARYLRRLNAIRSSTKSLPPEILTYIFQRVCSPDEESNIKRPQFTLGVVSTHWRTMAWDSPHLWNSVVLGPLHKTIIDNLVPFLQLHLDNARSAPVSLQLGSHPGHPGAENLREEQIDGNWMNSCILFLQSSLRLPQNAGKIHALHLHSTPPVFLPVLLFLPSLRKLSLSFDFDSWTYYTSFIKDGWDRVQNNLPWTTIITSLDLHRVPADVCFGLLIRCPNLVHFSSGSFGPSIVIGDPGCTTMTTLPHLRSFKWLSKTSDEWDCGVLRFLRFPELRDFAFHVWKDDIFISHFLDLLTTLPSSLDTIELHFGSEPTTSQLSAVLERIPQITRLISTSSSPTSLLDLFTTLRDSSLLPLLRVFKYVHQKLLPYTTFNAAAPSFLRLMEERRESGAKGFYLELMQAKLYWASYVRSSLRLLVEQGFELEIVEESVPVGWLRDQVQE